jgi:hypothetical protein
MQCSTPDGALKQFSLPTEPVYVVRLSVKLAHARTVVIGEWYGYFQCAAYSYDDTHMRQL